MALAMGAHLLQLILEMRNALPDHATIGLQLRLAGTTDTDAAHRTTSTATGLAGQVSPRSC
jgi:hypothetical protein